MWTFIVMETMYTECKQVMCETFFFLSLVFTPSSRRRVLYVHRRFVAASSGGATIFTYLFTISLIYQLFFTLLVNFVQKCH